MGIVCKRERSKRCLFNQNLRGGIKRKEILGDHGRGGKEFQERSIPFRMLCWGKDKKRRRPAGKKEIVSPLSCTKKNEHQ